jgi:hypothetical protein
MKCDNCERAAIYKVAPGTANPVHYCNLHLPEFLRPTADTGAYAIPAPASKKKSASTEPTE